MEPTPFLRGEAVVVEASGCTVTTSKVMERSQQMAAHLRRIQHLRIITMVEAVRGGELQSISYRMTHSRTSGNYTKVAGLGFHFN